MAVGTVEVKRETQPDRADHGGKPVARLFRVLLLSSPTAGVLSGQVRLLAAHSYASARVSSKSSFTLWVQFP